MGYAYLIFFNSILIFLTTKCIRDIGIIMSFAKPTVYTYTYYARNGIIYGFMQYYVQFHINY